MSVMIIKSKNIFFVLCFFILLLNSCLSIDVVLSKPVISCTKKKRVVDDVKITYAFPTEETEKIAEFSINFDSNYSRSDVLKKLQQKAATLGADILYITNINTGSSSLGYGNGRTDNNNALLQVTVTTIEASLYCSVVR